MGEINLSFTDKGWERTARDWSAWWAHELERPLVMIQTREQRPAEDDAGRSLMPMILDVTVEQVVDCQQTYLESLRFHGDAWPRWFVNGGPGAIAAFVGAPVDVQVDTGTVWFGEAGVSTLEALRLEYDAENVWWQRIKAVTQAGVERWGDRVSVSHTSLGANLDILASLRGTKTLLLDLYDVPDEVERLVDEITALWMRYYDELYQIVRLGRRGTTPWAPIWSSGRCCMIGCDFSSMISPAMFDRFAAPGLRACFGHLDHAFYHLDGPGELRHLDKFLAMPELAGIQWIPGAGAPAPEEWLSLLKRIRDGGKLCQISVTAAGARTICREIGGRGIAMEISEQMTSEEAENLLALIASENRAT